MTFDALAEHVWDELPTRKYLAGRKIVSRIVRRAVRSWPVSVLDQCDSHQTDVVGMFHARAVERSIRNEYGMGIFLTLVLSVLVQEVVKLLIRWWLDHRSEMRQLSAELENE